MPQQPAIVVPSREAYSKAELRHVVLAAMAVMRRDRELSDVTPDVVGAELGISGGELEWVFRSMGTTFDACLDGMRLGLRRRARH